jgi:phenylacetate-CoA ligase
MDLILSKLRANAPNAIAGFSGMVAAVAEALPEEDRRRLRVRYVRCGAETLTLAMRRSIEAAFGKSPNECYASHEFNAIAVECPTTGLLHISGGSVIVEVLRDGKAATEGEAGEAVVTSLFSYTMPFVRYRLGDLVERGPDRCPCHAPFSTLRNVQGRVVEMFHLPDGRTLHPYALVQTLLQHRSVRQYQLIQDRRDLIRVRVVGICATSTEPEELRVALTRASGSEVGIIIEPVEDIRPERSGKFRPYYSVVSDDRTGTTT